jgi:ankyrin repeat protein
MVEPRVAITTPVINVTLRRHSHLSVTGFEFSEPRLARRRWAELLLAIPKCHAALTLSTNTAEYRVNRLILACHSWQIAIALYRNPALTHFHVDLDDPGRVMDKYAAILNGGSATMVRSDRKFMVELSRWLWPRTGALPSSLTESLQRYSLVFVGECLDDQELELDPCTIAWSLSSFPAVFTLTLGRTECRMCELAVRLSGVLEERFEAGETSFEYNGELSALAVQLIVDYFRGRDRDYPPTTWADTARFAEDLRIDGLGSIVAGYMRNADSVPRIFADPDIGFDGILNLQLLLENLTEAGIPAACDAVIAAQWLANGARMRDFLLYMRPILSAKADHQQLIANFLARLHSAAGSEILVDRLMVLLDWGCESIAIAYRLTVLGVLPLDRVLRRICMEFQCAMHGDPISPLAYGGLLEEMDRSSRGIERTAMFGRYPLSFFFFVPELEAKFPALMTYFVKRHVHRAPAIHNFGKWDPEFAFAIEFGYLHRKRWLAYRRLRDVSGHPDPLAAAILADNAPALRRLLRRGAAPTRLIAPFPFTNCVEHTLISFAAMMGAANCAALMLELGASIPYSADRTGTLSSLGIAKLFHNKTAHPQTVLGYIRPSFSTFTTHNLDVLKWLFVDRFPTHNGDLAVLLQDALRQGHFPLLKYILERTRSFLLPSFPETVTTVTASGMTAPLLILDRYVATWDALQSRAAGWLEACARAGNLATLTLLRKRLTPPDVSLQASLVMAAYAGAEDCFRYIVETVDHKALASSVPRAWHAAAVGGSVEVARLLLGITDAREDMTEILGLIVRACDAGLFDVIAEAGLPFDVSGLFRTAIGAGNTRAARALWARGDCEIQDLTKAVTDAVAANAIDCLEFLMETDRRDSVLQMAMQAAIELRQPAIAEFLFPIGKNWRLTAADIICTRSSSLLRAVSASGVDCVEINGARGQRPLCVAVADGSLEMVKLILGIPGISIHVPAPNHHYPLTIAMQSQNLEIIRYFFENHKQAILSCPEVLRLALLNAFRAEPLPTNVLSLLDDTDERARFLDMSTISCPWVTPDAWDRSLDNSDFHNRVNELFKYLNSISELEPIWRVAASELLIVAALYANLPLMQKVLAIPAVNVNAYDHMGETALFKCCRSGFTDGLRLLLGNDQTDMNWYNKDGKSVLQMVAHFELDDILPAILCSPRFDLRKSNLGMALAGAALHRSVVTEPLFAIYSKTPSEVRIPQTFLKCFICGGWTDLVFQITNQPDFDPNGVGFRQAAGAAARTGNLEILKHLLSFVDDNVNIALNHQQSLLTISSRHVQITIIEFLINDPSFDAERSLALHAIREALERFPELLLSLGMAPGVDINAVLPADSFAKRRKSTDNLDAAPVEHMNALGLALRRGWSRALTILMQIPSLDPARRDGKGRTALFYAPLFMFFDFTRLLGGGVLDLNAQDEEGNTALHAAVIDERTEGFLQLLLLGVDRSIRNAKGETAWTLAQKCAMLPVKELIDEPEGLHEYTVKMVGLIMRRPSEVLY